MSADDAARALERENGNLRAAIGTMAVSTRNQS